MMEYGLFCWMLAFVFLFRKFFHKLIVYFIFLYKCFSFVYIRPIIKKFKNKPLKVKTKFNINLEGNIYTLNFENFIPKDMFDFLVITDENSRDVSEKIITLAGPLGNFLGQPVSPKDLGYKKLYINEKCFVEENIPSLKTFLN